MATNEGNDNSKSYAANGFYLEETHLFQEKLAQSPEFSDILIDVITAMKLAVLRDKTKGTKDAPFYAKKILEDKGTTYDTVDGTTLRLVSDEFYKRHTDDIGDILGEENLATLLRLKENNRHVECLNLYKYYGCYSFGGRSAFGAVHNINILDTLCDGVKPKVGDKILMTTNFLEDEEFGKLAKIDIYQYNNGKYKHFYQAYSPERDHDYKDTVDITIAMQKKTQATGIAKDKSNSGY